MKETARRRALERRREWLSLLVILISFFSVIAIGFVVFLRFYDSYIGILYQERLSQMQEVTTQLFEGIEDVVDAQWERVDVYCNYMELAEPEDTETLLRFIGKQNRLNNVNEKNADLVAVDDLGRYVTADGWQGMLEEMDLLITEPERVNFISKSMTNGKTNMYFLKRLPTPVTVNDGHRTVQLLYYGVMKNMEELSPYFSCEAYDNKNSVYVLSDQGERLFKSQNQFDLIAGYNAFNVLEQMEYLHGNSFDEARLDLEETGCGYANAVMNGEEYYYALYRMESSSWTLLFLVPSQYVAAKVVSMVNTTVRLLVIFAVIIISVSVLVILILMQLKQRQAVEAERRNSEKLEAVNEELSKAVKTAEQAEKIANDASRAKSEFLSNMSHDIRTPMNAIVGITSLMQHEKDDPEKMDLYIHKVQSSSQHLLGLINDVLDMSKIESSEVSLNREPVNLVEQVGQVDSIIRPQAEERNQSFIIRVHEIAHEFLIGDAVRLRQIFINLLSNAVKYTPEGGSVRLDLTEHPSSREDTAVIEITVTDNGCGMSRDFVKRIFEPFTRAEGSMTNKVQGTGLGMAITKNIVDMMGGTISVQSELGQGSKFTVTIPFSIDTGAHPEIDAESVLLITEEDTLIRNASASFLHSGLSFHVARGAEDAKAFLQTHTVDTILISGHFHDPKLHDLVDFLHRQAKDAVLVFCVDYEQQEQVGDILARSGADGLIARPFFLTNFAGVVNEARSDTASSAQEDGSVLTGMKFLCAEDNSLNAEILSAILDMNGASCTIYPDGKQLVDAFANVQPGEYDAILMDVQMPVMNGLEATRRIRRGINPLGKTIPIIAMTANAFSSDIQECLEAGMDAHVAKPLDIAMLERTLKLLKSTNSSGGYSCPS